MNLCQYKDSLGKPNEGVHSYRFFNLAIVDVLMIGKPNEGVHSYRFFNLAIVDVLMTIVLGFVVKWIVDNTFLINYFGKLPNYTWIFIFFIMGVFLHHIFCVRTTIDKFLFP